MYIQCCRCHESTWIRSLVPGLGVPTVKCQDCGHEHDLSRSSKLGETGKEQYELAKEFAARNRVDLPAAYSILLGLMTLEEARAAAVKTKEKGREKTSSTPVATNLEALDIADTAASVPEPGGPEAEASVVVAETDDFESIEPEAPAPVPQRRHSNAARHRRSRPREKRVTILVERERADQRRKLTLGNGILIGLLAVLMIGLSGRHAYRTWRDLVEESKNAQRTTSASGKAVVGAEKKALAEARANRTAVPEALTPKIVRDGRNRVTQVVGPSPMAVLTAYCEALSASEAYEREPLELAQTMPPTPNARFGIFRDFSRLEAPRAIRIVQDRETRRWVAGDGRRPVPTREAPDEPDTIQRVSSGAEI